MYFQVHATGGPNLGFRFPGSGALVYTKTVTDPICSYGGLVYAYTPTAIRFWRPEPVINGGMVCIGSVYGTGINAQSDPHGKAVTTLWASTFERVNPPTTTPKLSKLSLNSIDTHFNASITKLLKTLWEKKKLLVTSNFFFSRKVF